jgi:hypothetical protein
MRIAESPSMTEPTGTNSVREDYFRPIGDKDRECFSGLMP